jgi:hypothetical protein
MNKFYTEQEIRDFYDGWDKVDEHGCQSIHIPTWEAMSKQNPSLCIELEVQRKMRIFNKEFCDEV